MLSESLSKQNSSSGFIRGKILSMGNPKIFAYFSLPSYCKLIFSENKVRSTKPSSESSYKMWERGWNVMKIKIEFRKKIFKKKTHPLRKNGKRIKWCIIIHCRGVFKHLRRSTILYERHRYLVKITLLYTALIYRAIILNRPFTLCSNFCLPPESSVLLLLDMDKRL